MRAIISFILLVVGGPCFSSTWDCNEVDNFATLAYSGAGKVVVQGDASAMTCKFSVNDASADGNSGAGLDDNVIQGLNFDPHFPYLNGSIVSLESFIQEGLLRELYLSILAFEGGDSPLSSKLRDLADRFPLFNFDSCLTSDSLNEGDLRFTCRYIEGGQEPVNFESSWVFARLGGPYLIVEVDDTSSSFRYLAFFSFQ